MINHRSFYLDPHGCAKNQVDGEVLMAYLLSAGWQAVGAPEDADLIVVNSCGFIQSAKEESIEAVMEWKKLFPSKKILLAGCLAQRYGEALARELPEADALFGNMDLSLAPQAAEAALASTHQSLLPPLPSGSEKEGLSCFTHRPLTSFPGSAYVKLTEGCDNRCSYCAIPLIRGPLRSRPVESIVEECQALLQRGVRELCLVGQDLGSYGKDIGPSREGEFSTLLPELVRRLSQLSGDFWIRLLYIHPDHFPGELLELCEKDPRILPYFDLPFQHASPRILRLMNRKGNPETYLDLIKRIRDALPHATIRSTFLVGFPGETEEDFQTLRQFQEAAQLDWLGVFAYSREEDTPAYHFKGRVPQKIALHRKKEIETAQIPITENRLERLVGQELQIIVEEQIENEENLYIGRGIYHAPEVDGAVVLTASQPLQVGTFTRSRIVARCGFDLDGVNSDGS
ncbi:30S ribosomal protein S12 methylthiotransferase RimO [Treponema sp. J25]|uniref:30S ribosomal protein S12 methylthiotransferase RimO n=1 Tax=Treponema sp. J25 TaxID=2094121 RepID=UPI0010483170|nr:30S ribosomal protein S12 methylthiotransferase RimO [Treponema sp. J25]TCW60959.1 30S ribosomal protein S12 methylthiotransferase RimO [Treponema sp. J25]